MKILHRAQSTGRSAGTTEHRGKEDDSFEGSVGKASRRALNARHSIQRRLSGGFGLLFVLGSVSLSSGQEFRIGSAAVVSNSLQILFTGKADSYYLLHGAGSLSVTSAVVEASLGAGSSQLFQRPLTGKAMFFRLEQLPLTSTNSLLGDPVPDAWKLQQGLSIFDPTVLNQIAPGGTNTWYRIYTNDLALSLVPLAYYPISSSTVIAGASEIDVPVAFTKPFKGLLTYHLSGTAIPNAGSLPGTNGDYFQPAGYIAVANQTTATIAIQLTPRQAVETDRTLVVALSVTPNSTNRYTITNATSVHTVRIAQSLQGVYLGTLSITNGLAIGPQQVKMAIRPGSLNGTVAFFDVTGNPLLGDNFSVPVTYDANGFQLNGGFSRQLTNAPLARPLSLTLSFGATQTNGVTFTVPATMTLNGLTASGVPYSGVGYLNLINSTRSQ